MATQAPWKWHKRKHSNTYFLANENETDDFCMIIDDGSAYGEYDTSIDVNGEDAQLIAAAPELLEALHKLRVYAEDVCGVCPDDCHEEHPLILASSAIAKALGETK